jgi:hypothetical protein
LDEPDIFSTHFNVLGTFPNGRRQDGTRLPLGAGVPHLAHFCGGTATLFPKSAVAPTSLFERLTMRR